MGRLPLFPEQASTFAPEAWEYAVMISITNDRGEEVTRQVVGVGAIPPGEQRKFTFSVEVFTPAGALEPDREVAIP